MTVQPLATTTDLQAFRDADPQQLVSIATGAVRRYCSWHIGPSLTETVVVDSEGTQTLLLPSLHVTAVSQVRDMSPDTPEVLDKWRSQPTPRFRAGILERTQGYRWPCGPIEVAFTHGFDPVPPEVQGVVLDLVESLQNAMGGATRRQVGAVSVQFAAEQITPVHKVSLDLYKLPALP